MALRMLLVDDDRDVLEVAEAFLTRTDDIDVVTETDPERAVDRLDSVDCLVTDYRMPGADGIDLCRRVTGEHDLPVLVLTALDPDEVADDMQRMLNDWYAKMGQLIREFETKYDQTEATAPSAES